MIKIFVCLWFLIYINIYIFFNFELFGNGCVDFIMYGYIKIVGVKIIYLSDIVFGYFKLV